MLKWYIWKEELCQLSKFWMKESEKLARWSRLTAVMQMEWEDQASMSENLEGSLWAGAAVRWRNAAVLAVVMYWKWVDKEVDASMPRG